MTQQSYNGDRQTFDVSDEEFGLHLHGRITAICPDRRTGSFDWYFGGSVIDFSFRSQLAESISEALNEEAWLTGVARFAADGSLASFDASSLTIESLGCTPEDYRIREKAGLPTRVALPPLPGKPVPKWELDSELDEMVAAIALGRKRAQEQPTSS